jgi:hypothetical protein
MAQQSAHIAQEVGNLRQMHGKREILNNYLSSEMWEEMDLIYL